VAIEKVNTVSALMSNGDFVLNGQKATIAHLTWMGVSAAFWMNLQKRYELDIARERIDDKLKVIEPLHSTNTELKMQQF
jgi:plasmid maintenance system antidote protein VapI